MGEEPGENNGTGMFREVRLKGMRQSVLEAQGEVENSVGNRSAKKCFQGERRTKHGQGKRMTRKQGSICWEVGGREACGGGN